jgi:alkyl hydroperoxide reductase subunit F
LAEFAEFRKDMYDLIIVGAGPAGMTAAVYAARKKIGTLLLSRDVGGQMTWTLGIENYMGYQFIEGPELIRKFNDQVKQFPIEQRIGEAAESITRSANGYEIITDKGRYQGKSVIVATGKRPRQLEVPGEERLKGRGVSYCATCDAPIFAEERVAVIGGGNSALEAVDDTVKLAEHVYLVSLTQLTGDQVLIDRLGEPANLTVLLGHEVLEIEGPEIVEAIRLRDSKDGREKRLKVAGVFVEIGLVPNSEFAKELVHTNEVGEITMTNCCETGTPGLFAAGDVTEVPEKQIVVAAGEGAKAALRAHSYLRRL